MTLTGKMVELIWFGFGKNSTKRSIITEVGIMKEQLVSINTSVLNQVLDSPAVKRTGTTHNSMHLITFFQKQLGQIRAILSRDAGDEGFFQIDDKLKKTNESFESIKAKFNMRIFELINQ